VCHHTVWYIITKVSEEDTVSIFRVEQYARWEKLQHRYIERRMEPRVASEPTGWKWGERKYYEK
jgi:hypothetical protein